MVFFTICFIIGNFLLNLFALSDECLNLIHVGTHNIGWLCNLRGGCGATLSEAWVALYESDKVTVLGAGASDPVGDTYKGGTNSCFVAFPNYDQVEGTPMEFDVSGSVGRTRWLRGGRELKRWLSRGSTGAAGGGGFRRAICGSKASRIRR